ncbi:MAG TPA: thiamine-binding protein [Myxococcota bacterium]|nr:thiamine-binding protein [Myxococcota bacterium]
MIAEIRITPVSGEASFPRLIAQVVDALAETPLLYQVNAMGTAVEGTLEQILDAVPRLHAIARKHAERVLIEVAIDDRAGAEGELTRSLERVKRLEVATPLERLVHAEASRTR